MRTLFQPVAHDPRYDYSWHKNFASADAALEDMFAAGDVCEGEAPDIEKRHGRDGKTRFVITLRGA